MQRNMMQRNTAFSNPEMSLNEESETGAGGAISGWLWEGA